MKIQSAAKQALTTNHEQSGTEQTLREYVECESQSDPNFFRWLFAEEFPNDFDSDLTPEYKEAFEYFLNTL